MVRRCARVLHGTLIVPILMYGSDTMLWQEKERSRVRAVQMDNLKRLLGIRRTNRVPNAPIRELCGVRKGQNERIDEGPLLWLGHVEKIERDRERVYAGEFASSRSLGRPRKRWNDTVK